MATKKTKKKNLFTKEEVEEVEVKEMESEGDADNECHLCDDPTLYSDADLQKHISQHIKEFA